MLYLILYIIAFFITSIVFIVLYGSRKQEFPLFGEKFHKIPLVNIRVLKLVPTLISVLFVIFTAPRYDYFYILIILAFIFTFLGDLGIIIYNFLGLAFYYITHIFLAIAYITQIIQFSLKIIGFYSIISIGIILYLVIILYFYRFLAVNLEDKYRRTKIVITVVFLYIAFILLHIITAAIFVLDYFNINKGIISIIFGAILYLISDVSIFVRDATKKQKYSVLQIMATYYLALFCISLITQFY